MFGHTSFEILNRRRRPLLVAALAGMALSLLVTAVFFPLEYRADAQVLIISKSRYGIDPYTIVKSAERVGENIAEVMKTTDFFEKVMAQGGYDIDQSKFQNVSERVKRKRWTKAVQGSVVYGTGVLNVAAYDRTPERAAALAAATVDTLASRAWEYVGGDVTIKVVNAPIVSRLPARPNLVVNALAGFAAGALAFAFWVMRRG